KDNTCVFIMCYELLNYRKLSDRILFFHNAFTRLAIECQLFDVGTTASGAHERDGLRLGVDGRNGNRDLADGAIVPDDFATSAADCGGDLVLEHRCADWRNRNSHGLQHRLRLARVSALCRGCSFCRLRADYVVGGVDFLLSPWPPGSL